jgi:hypothetical protein
MGADGMSERGRSERASSRASRVGAWVAAGAFLAAAACGGDSATGPDGGDGGDAGELNLAVGESQVVEGGSDGLSFSLPGPGDDGAEYRLAVQSAARSSGATPMRVSIEGGGSSSSVTAGPQPRADARRIAGGGWRAGEPSPEQLGLAARIRFQEQARRMLVREGVRPARAGATEGGELSRSIVSAQLTEGETVTLSFPIVEEDDESFRATCNADSARTVTAEVKALGDTAAMLEDTATSDLGSANMDYQALAQNFDDAVFGVDLEYFGSPTDIDGNGHVIVLFSPKVNDLSDPGSQGIVTGLFNPNDLADNGDAEGDGGDFTTCEAGNEGELLYMVAPDPEGNRDAGTISAGQAERIARSTSSHEFQHLLNAANRVIKQDGTFANLEELWLNEALSHLAEEIVGFSENGLAVRSNLSAPEAGSGQGGEQEESFDTFLADNLQNLALFMENPATTQAILASDDPGGLESLRIRGFGWIFLRWLADREFAGSTGQVPGTGDPEEGFFRQLAKADGQDLEAGISNVEGVTGREWPDLLGEFSPMPAVDDDVQGLVQRHRLLSWNMREIYQQFPLAADTTGFGAQTFEFEVEAGGAKHVFISSSGSASGVTIELTDQAGAALTAGEPQITVVRTR